MATSVETLDAELITTVPVANMPVREFGVPAGLWFIGMSGTGTASGNPLIITGSLTFVKKQEHVYEWMNVNVFTDSVLNDSDLAELSLFTGPRIPSAGGNFNNPVFREILPGVGMTTPDNTAWAFTLGSSTRNPVIAYGDKSIAGNFLVASVTFNVNDLAVEYFMFGWGFYYRYQTFFRGIEPGASRPVRPL